MGERPLTRDASAVARNARVRFGTFEVDLKARELRKAGLKVKLRGQPFEVLALLLERPGEVFTRDELQQKLWGSDTIVDFEHGLNKAINKLRDALGDTAENPRYIETLPRHGYRFVAATAMDIPELERKPRLRRASVALVAAAVLVIAGVLFILDMGGVRSKIVRRAAQPQIHSLAVLPLTNMSGDPQQEYFADGMTEELITELSQIGALKIISRTSVMRYKASSKPLPQIARELGVDGIIEGSVLRSGDRVRVNVQLIHGPSDVHLWAKSYERDMREILTLQSDIAQTIVAEIQAQLTPGGRTRLAKSRPVNPEAYELYLKGRYEWNKRSEEALKKALDYFQGAIALDAAYALAYSGIADVYTTLANNSFLSGKEGYSKAKAAALRGVALDESSAEAHVSLAATLFNYDHNPEAALKELQTAINLNPNYATAHHWYAFELSEMGRSDEAIREITIARKLDPLSIRINANVALVLYQARRYDQALMEAEKALELEPNDSATHGRLGDIYIQKGMTKEAIAEFKEEMRLVDSSNSRAGLVRAYAADGNRVDALRFLRELKRQSAREYVSPYLFARAYTAVGENDEALTWLQKGFEDFAGGMDRMKVEPDLDPLRSDPRFQDLLRRMNLIP
jgi:TolB-like protein/DNA-binding winged helix-turn-helix (wHTH) protein/Tfp pilus assembly protein PilF